MDVPKMILAQAAVTALGGALLGSVAHADFVPMSHEYGFTQFTTNGSSGAAAGLSIAVRNYDWQDNELGAGYVSFLVSNTNALATSITGVYFEDGTVLGISGINQYLGLPYNDPGAGAGKGTDFAVDGNPQNVPSGNTVNFSATQSHRATVNGSFRGANGGEWVEILFQLQDGNDYSDVVAAIAEGQKKTAGQPYSGATLRFAMHVQGIGPYSESFINSIPLPAPVGMGLAGLVGVVAFSVRRRKLTNNTF